MSFVFPSWSTAFSPAFYDDAKAMLETALNKGNKPPVIQGRIEVVGMSMGTQPPTLTLLEIGDLSLDRFRGILRLGYQGDAWIEVRCRVQANPLSHNPNLNPTSTLPVSAPLLASQPLLVPMTLRLSLLHLRAILILVVSASKGITLVFKNDPLQNVEVSSTFDSVEVIRGYLQQEIEGQLREMFREDLPGIIHRLSQKWFSKGTGGHVETPYRDVDNPDNSANSIPPVYDDEDDDRDPTEAPQDIFPPNGNGSGISHSTPKKRGGHRVSSTNLRNSTSSTAGGAGLSESPTSYTVFPDIENYDPTYGLRPEGLPTHSGYEAFGRLWERNRSGGGRGLGSLMGETEHTPLPSQQNSDESSSEEEEEAEEEECLSETDDIVPDLEGVPSRSSFEWEAFPAVGGGMVSRPRVFHAQSQIRAPSESGFGGAMPSPAATATGGSVTARASSIGTSTVGSYVPAHSTLVAPKPVSPVLRRTMTSSSDFTRRDLVGRDRAGSRSRPESLAAVSQLATLSLSANTLSPYARAHEHIAVRSFPHLGTTPPVVAAPQEVKATRKRIFRLGSKPTTPESETPKPLSPAPTTPPLEWDDSIQPSSSSEASRWRSSRRAESRTSYGFPRIPEEDLRKGAGYVPSPPSTRVR
ncbi:biogenesis-related protein [Trichosporon asahii var. asahii CBS 2479]|uniref:Mitochondrial distribution and morphology protein 34 n=1 Tax=Trichosporon asahii var. asahii (strain ATCC 90039 / CBS 2479 / JCM 2466 / KCTC 7840 / NBRC 103889/ NCYC 2677 / UAMH 7654) TaxID=1186058 RepID=J8TY42_TRIAS|nr:biogenesis-related protein [Trichosporon asahii var. asahii CBS 2479]EJT53017.1 biogenesis-related protein [Trichosporon asahii var. asahii CBS 2479]